MTALKVQDALIVQSSGSFAGSARVVDFVGLDVSSSLGTVTVTGVSESGHQDLDTLVHWIDQDSYDEITHIDGLTTSVITWTSPARVLKVREEIVTRTLQLQRISQIVTKQYDRSTGQLKETMTETYTRTNGRISSVTRTRVP